MKRQLHRPGPAVQSVVAAAPRPTFFAAALCATALSCPLAVVTVITHLVITYMF